MSKAKTTTSKVRNGIYKRGKSWYILYKVDGTQYRKSYGPDKRMAELALAEIKKQIARGNAVNDWSGLEKLVTPRSKKTFAYAAQEYMAERINLKPSTLARYRSILDVHLLPEFGDVPLKDISESLVAKFQARLPQTNVPEPKNKKRADKPAGTKKLSPVTANRIVELLRFILDENVRRGDIDTSPAKNVRRLQEPRTKIEPLTEEELELVLSKIPERYQPLFITWAFTGARPNELLALRWSDIGWKRKEINISKGRVRGHEGLPKTAASERALPMVARVETALKALEQSDGANIAGYVFVTKKLQPMDRQLNAIWSSALRKAGIAHRPSYQLRHTFASQCLMKGLSPGYVAKLLGHTTLETMYRHYARWIDDASREQEKILRGVVGQQSAAGDQKGDHPSIVKTGTRHQ